MALKNIIERIDARAQEEAQTIIAEAKERAEKTRQNAKGEAQNLAEAALKKAREDAETHRRRLVTLASLDLRKQIGDARQDSLENAFTEAIARIQAMDDAEYLPMLKALIVGAAETGEELVVLSAADRARVGDDFLAQANAELKALGKKGNLKFSDEIRESLGGAVLIGENVELNCTFDSTLKLIRDDIEPEVASLLFGGALHK